MKYNLMNYDWDTISLSLPPSPSLFTEKHTQEQL